MPNEVGIPKFSLPFVDKNGVLVFPWPNWLVNLLNKTTVGQPTQVQTLGTSPFLFTAPSSGFLTIGPSGGALTVHISRDGVNFYGDSGIGCYPMRYNDRVDVLWTGAAPQVVFFPD